MRMPKCASAERWCGESLRTLDVSASGIYGNLRSNLARQEDGAIGQGKDPEDQLARQRNTLLRAVSKRSDDLMPRKYGFWGGANHGAGTVQRMWRQKSNMTTRH